MQHQLVYVVELVEGTDPALLRDDVKDFVEQRGHSVVQANEAVNLREFQVTTVNTGTEEVLIQSVQATGVEDAMDQTRKPGVIPISAVPS